MKLFIASDIHGSAYWCRQMIEAYRAEKADRMLLLGDILYHGPRNDLPKEYAPKEVIALLNSMKREIFCVRGNCDTEVDQMVLPFPILADYAVIPVGNQLMYCTHGHVYNGSHLPPLADGDILIHGHTHVPLCDVQENVTTLFVKENSVSERDEKSAVTQFFHILNSVAMPKGCVRTAGGFAYTRYGSCCNVDRGIYYYTTYDYVEPISIHMHDVDLNRSCLYTSEVKGI